MHKFIMNLRHFGMSISDIKFSNFLIAVLFVLSCEPEEVALDNKAVFNTFSTNGQTLPASIDAWHKKVMLEVDHDVDFTKLVPEFDIPAGYTAYVNRIPQVSGSSTVDFSQDVIYELKDQNNQSTTWIASAVPLTCKILIDASHDGGVWWFPQSATFNPDQWHQGQPFANLLREKGFEVHELGRGVDLTEAMFFGYYIVIRANGFQTYKANELEVYTKLIDRGMNLVYFTDHMKNDPVDELGDHLGLQFQGSSNGIVTTFATHEITADLTSIDYIAGSVLTNAAQNPDIEVLGWLGEDDYGDLDMNGIKDANEPVAPAVMGILNYPNSRIFFIGDTNGLEVQPQPFIDNLIQWMGTCFQN
ncbi:MAG: hypothetical protein WD824_21935 [Cyclobacteriaceae bacterium]